MKLEVMNFIELAKSRSSVRTYLSKKVEEDKISYMLDCARFAPSAVNSQPWTFIIVQEEENRKHLQACYDREWFKSAPLYILVCGSHSQSWHRKSDNKDHCDIDVAIAVDHLVLAATEQGLGTCWVCNFDVALCSTLFQLSNDVEPIVILAIGYSDGNDAAKIRKEMKEIVIRK